MIGNKLKVNIVLIKRRVTIETNNVKKALLNIGEYSFLLPGLLRNVIIITTEIKITTRKKI